MPNLLSRLSRVWFRRPATRASVRRFAPGLELLEDRTVPAGVVNATFAAGVLTITALNDPNDVNILNTNHQNITLNGAGGDDITVSANTGETGTAFSTFNNVKKITLIMGLGNDTVTITNATLTGLVSVNGGSGDNTLNIDGAGNFSGEGVANVTLGSIKVTNGDGFDSFAIGGGQHTINGSVTINNGQGGSDTIVNVLPADTTTIGGTTSVTNLDGVDLFEVTSGSVSATFTGKVTLRNGDGDTTTQFAAITNTLTGGISVTNDDGTDEFITLGTSFFVGTASARRNLTISNSSGSPGASEQNFNATTNTINGNLVVSAEVGFDEFQVNGTNFVVLGTVSISTGNGGSDTSFSPTNFVDIGSTVRVSCGEGADNLVFDGATSVNLASVQFNSSNGNSDLQFNGAATNVSGQISHTSAAGNSSTSFNATTTSIDGTIIGNHGDGFDLFDVNGASFSSAGITIANRHGDSQTFIDAASNTIGGTISISNRDGVDHFEANGAWTLGTPAARRNLAIQNGDGGSLTRFFGTATINGSIQVTNNDGFDSFEVNTTAFTVSGSGSVTIRHGSGNSETFIDSGVGSIGGQLNLTATDGIDLVGLAGLSVTGITSFNTGNGDDAIQTANSTFGVFRVTAGAGADEVLIEIGVNDGINTVFNGGVNINLGGGDDVLLIGTDADDLAVFNAAVTFAGGLDLDILQENAPNTFDVPPVITGFEQVT